MDERLHDPAATAREQDALRSALVAFSANTGAQELVARLLSDARLGDRQTLFLLDTVDASTARQFPQTWKAPLAGLLAQAEP